MNKKLLWGVFFFLIVVACEADNPVDVSQKYRTLPKVTAQDLSVPANAVPAATITINVPYRRFKQFYINKQAGKHYVIGLTNLTGDLDLFGHWLPNPSYSNYHKFSAKYGRSEEELVFDAEKNGRYYISVFGFEAAQARLKLYVTDAKSSSNTNSDLFRQPWGEGEPSFYLGRSFFYNSNHLGADIKLNEGAPVKAGVKGKIVVYRPSRGYGELVAVIEVDLGSEKSFINAHGETIKTRYVLWILGHIRKSQRRGGTPLSWKVGDVVGYDDVIGYINDDAHNGDGREHVHIGLRLQSARDAQRTDPRAWFRGYKNGSKNSKYYADAIRYIREF